VTLAHLCLGTASWATDAPYNDRVPPSDAELTRILDVAEVNGIRWLDTSVLYGNVEARLIDAKVYEKFQIVTKVRSLGVVETPFEPYAKVWLYHARPDEVLPQEFRHNGWRRLGQSWGMSVYTLEQATAALDLRVQVLQVPWNSGTVDEQWTWIRNRAYGDGVMFFGRQPFARGSATNLRGWFEFALNTNPRGWCVVGVETAAQVEELCRWREEIAR
jgi:aryl-alcohol dehydrogenase-like predicted oxidoreductase